MKHIVILYFNPGLYRLLEIQKHPVTFSSNYSRSLDTSAFHVYRFLTDSIVCGLVQRGSISTHHDVVDLDQIMVRRVKCDCDSHVSIYT